MTFLMTRAYIVVNKDPTNKITTEIHNLLNN